jgi:EAL domain-containing protein (putative c-di-GMP-specific phosphodiesterase class I)
MGTQFGQGHLFQRPVPLEHAAAALPARDANAA